jgi:hypothetical protein
LAKDTVRDRLAVRMDMAMYQHLWRQPLDYRVQARETPVWWVVAVACAQGW